MLCAIHQPNFFPWMGYFNKIARCDVFVFLDNVDYPKSGHSMSSFCNRVAVKAGDDKCQISCPVVREHGAQKIKDVMIHNDLRDWRGIIKDTLQTNYHSAPFFREGMDVLLPIIDYETDHLSKYNIHAIKELCKALGLKKKFYIQSEDPEMNTEKHSTELLIDIIRKTECDSYICGKGSAKYQEEELFENAEIEVLHQNYLHPVYPQGGGVQLYRRMLHHRSSVVCWLRSCGEHSQRKYA